MSPGCTVLIFNQYFVPGFRGGGPIVSVYNLSLLLANDYRVFVVCRNRDGLTTVPYANVLTDQWQQLEDTNVRVFYASDAAITRDRFAALIKETTPDYVMLNSFFNPKFSILPYLAARAVGLPPQRIVINPRGEFDADSLRIKPLKKYPFLWGVRLTGLGHKFRWAPTNATEEADTRRLFGNRITAYKMSNIPRQRIEPPRPPRRPPFTKFVFLSRVDRKKNVEYIVQRLSEQPEAVSLAIYGPIANDAYWRSVQQAMAQAPDHVTITYEGEVEPAKIPEVLSAYDYFVLPTLGENFGHAIMDGLACGLPVLLSDRTPWAKHDHPHFGYSLPLESPALWQTAIRNMVTADAATYRAWSENARALATRVANDPNFRTSAARVFPCPPPA